MYIHIHCAVYHVTYIYISQSSYGAESDLPQGSYNVVESFPDGYE